MDDKSGEEKDDMMPGSWVYPVMEGDRNFMYIVKEGEHWMDMVESEDRSWVNEVESGMWTYVYKTANCNWAFKSMDELDGHNGMGDGDGGMGGM